MISGKQEGVYAWIAANYALQKFGHGDEDRCTFVLPHTNETRGNGGVYWSRQIVGWSVGERLCLKLLEMVLTVLKGSASENESDCMISI